MANYNTSVVTPIMIELLNNKTNQNLERLELHKML